MQKNLLMQYYENNCLTYRDFADLVNDVLIREQSKDRVSHESMEDYCKGQKKCKRQAVARAMAIVIGVELKDLMQSLLESTNNKIRRVG
ncbi:MAG: hypothetical protein E7378_03185 [Clostridiales bacterium]|nr:hypothetical protein [Clostridiales bacterium]